MEKCEKMSKNRRKLTIPRNQRGMTFVDHDEIISSWNILHF